MDENNPQPSIRPPDLTPPPSSPPPPDLRAPDLGPPPPSIPAPSIPDVGFAPPPVMEIPEEAKKKPKEVVPDEDEVKVGDIAPFNTRIIAALIDWAVFLAVYIVVNMIPGVPTIVAYLAGCAYTITKDSLPFLGGQSIGKKAMKLRAVTFSAEKPLTGDWQTGATRNAFLVVPILPLVEFVILLTREEKPEKGRRLGDDFAKTKVIVVADDMVAPEA
jgi:uncharacterized RDD family membrane protein YckC